MLDGDELSRMLDLLGNKNRRRILILLSEKPCFVTEISDKLMISPKAVIDHLSLMEQENILSCRVDESRRKYYYLVRNFRVEIHNEENESQNDKESKTDEAPIKSKETIRPKEPIEPERSKISKKFERSEEFNSDFLQDRLRMAENLREIRIYMNSREKLVNDLEDLDRGIDRKLNELKLSCKDIISTDTEYEIISALAGYDLSREDLSYYLQIPDSETASGLKNLEAKGIVSRTGQIYKLCV